MEQYLDALITVLVFGTIAFFILLCIIARQLYKIANRSSVPRIQRVIWKSREFDFRNVADCRVEKSNEEPSLDLEGFECVALIHTDRMDGEGKHIVERLYAKIRTN